MCLLEPRETWPFNLTCFWGSAFQNRSQSPVVEIEPITPGLPRDWLQVHLCHHWPAEASASPNSRELVLAWKTQCKTLHWFWKLIPRGEKNASLKIKPGKSGFQPVRCLTFLHSWMLSLPHTFSDNNNRISNNHNRKARSETKVELNAKRLGGVKFHAENYAPKKFNLGNHT